ncbi:esterase-like activity of phytase family protein [Marinobacterium rhizophilum]|uniref:Esterase-like activity of phytase family protein n=1 Tax=Marinobacterium rhizophilum TaxID=420402 RepID=A0ABY5HF20_9GAMM|nr:esterase-like activity of phytase family protein [Marinobacterium rhizophilum]UTW10950.1 esterase-like activity of phytase family protein [Marinobacterium rhizophilum]
MSERRFTQTALALLMAAAASTAQAQSFNRIASFPVAQNLAAQDAAQETSAEIIAASADGQTLVYSDSPRGGLGFVDIRDADKPRAAGFVDMGGEPTSVATIADMVLAGVNTSPSYTAPSGFLTAVSLQDHAEKARCDLGGQPDSVAVSKDGRFAAVAIENERDEDLGDGAPGQLPAGYLTILPLKDGVPQCDAQRRVELTGLADIAGEDPEPEFVDFNDRNEIVVTLQENNHLVIVAAESGEILHHFSAGAVDLEGIDTARDGQLDFSGSQSAALREPDAVKWLDDARFVIANEGDYQGGARGFTIFHKDGRVLFESGADFEQRIVAAGHYPEKRSGKKGAEPEGVAVGVIGDQRYIFVLSERASVIGVYRDTGAAPEFVQLLPSGIAPESAVLIPSRGLLASANEKDLAEDGGARSHVMLFRLGDAAPAYPQLVSEPAASGLPLGWGALSGLAADPAKAGLLYAVNDSFYSQQPSIFTIDASAVPARITSAMPVMRDGKAAEKLDLEGIVADGEGGFWLASEGRTDKDIPHAIYHTNAQGEIDQTLNFPPELLQHEKRFGAEGITLIGDTLWIAIQRAWKDDPENTVKLVSYDLKTQQWGAVRYPTQAATSGWVGLSEISLGADGVYIIERDNQIGEKAAIKRLYHVAMDELKPAALGSDLPLVNKQLVRDFIPDLKALNGFVVDKIEGFTLDAAGNGFAVTDNDGVDDSSGETYFFATGKL